MYTPRPPPEIEIGLNMNAIEQREVIKYILHSTPSPFQNHYLILYLNRKLVNFNLKWMWIYGLEPHPPPLSSQKNKMLIFGLHSTSDDRLSWLMDLNPIHHPSQTKKSEMLIFGLHSTSDDRPGWLMDSNPICHPSPAKKMKGSFLDYIQLLMIGQAG